MTRTHRKGGPSHISECLAALMDEIETGRVAHADRPGSDEAARNGQSHDGGLQHTATNGLLREERNG